MLSAVNMGHARGALCDSLRDVIDLRLRCSELGTAACAVVARAGLRPGMDGVLYDSAACTLLMLDM
jgi:hypothetical protein